MPVDLNPSFSSLGGVGGSDFPDDDFAFNDADSGGEDFGFGQSGFDDSSVKEGLPALESHGLPLNLLMNLPQAVKLNALLLEPTVSLPVVHTAAPRAASSAPAAPKTAPTAAPDAPWQLPPEGRQTLDQLFAQERTNLDRIDATKGFLSFNALGSATYKAADEYRDALNRAETAVNAAKSPDDVMNAVNGLESYRSNVKVWEKVGARSNEIGAAQLTAIWEAGKGLALLGAPPVGVGMQVAETGLKQLTGTATNETYAMAALGLVPEMGLLKEAGSVYSAGKALTWAKPVFSSAEKAAALGRTAEVAQALNNGPVTVAVEEGTMMLKAGAKTLGNYVQGVDQGGMQEILKDLHVIYGESASLVKSGADMTIEVGTQIPKGAQVLMQTVGGSGFTHTAQLANEMKSVGQTGRVMLPVAPRAMPFTIK